MPRTSIITLLTAKFLSRNSFTSTTGCSCRHSQRTKAIRQAPAMTAKRTMVREWNQSSSCPLSRTYSSAPRPTAIRPSPMPSMGPTLFFASTRCGGSVTTRLERTKETIPTGTLMKKTQRQE